MKQFSPAFSSHRLVFFVFLLAAAISSVVAHEATLTENNFSNHGAGTSGPAACDSRYHSNNELIVALSDKWFEGRCMQMITIYGNGNSVKAQVVDECARQDGCPSNTVDASAAVWNALGVDDDRRGEMKVTWDDA